MLLGCLSPSLRVNKGDEEAGGIRLFVKMDKSVCVTTRLHRRKTVVAILHPGAFGLKCSLQVKLLEKVIFHKGIDIFSEDLL